MRRTGRSTSRTVLALLLGVVALAAAATGCTEEGLTGVEGEEPPGQAADAVSVSVPVDQLPLWRDTTYTGFATVGDSPFILVADQPPLRARPLFRIGNVPDSVGGQVVDSTGDMYLQVVADTARSQFSGDSATLELYALSRDFSSDRATWELASEGSPWDSAGGDLSSRLADLRFRRGTEADTAAPETLRMTFHGDPDSLISAWSESGRVPPLALLLRGEGNRMVIRNMAIELDAKNADMDSLEQIRAGMSTSTFIHDPDLPSVGQKLRAGGLPSSRFYFVFRPPDSIESVPIRGAQVNRAELVFHPVSEANSPFRPPVLLSALPTRLLADPFELGARTPIGDPIGAQNTRSGVVALDPDSLSAGRPLRIRVTDLIQSFADAPGDSIDQFEVGLRPVPDGQDLGFWDFGSAEAAEGMRPELRILITPSTDFVLP